MIPANRRRPTMHPVELPPEVRRVLGLIAADIRDVPRDCLHDPGELFVWLRRMAARVEGVERIRAETQPQHPKPAPEPQDLTVGGVLGLRGYPGAAGPKSAPRAGKSGRRIITGPQGRTIPVETRSLTLWP